MGEGTPQGAIGGSSPAVPASMLAGAMAKSSSRGTNPDDSAALQGNAGTSIAPVAVPPPPPPTDKPYGSSVSDNGIVTSNPSWSDGSWQSSHSGLPDGDGGSTWASAGSRSGDGCSA